MGNGRVGIVYLIHFGAPLPRGRLGRTDDAVRHYLGWTVDLDARLAEHRSGAGSKLMAAIRLAGIAWHVSRTWDGTRDLEVALKRGHHHAWLCPDCITEGRLDP